MLNYVENSYITHRIQLCNTGYSYIILSCIRSAYALTQVWGPPTPLLSKVNKGAEFQNESLNIICRNAADKKFIPIKRLIDYITTW